MMTECAVCGRETDELYTCSECGRRRLYSIEIERNIFVTSGLSGIVQKRFLVKLVWILLICTPKFLV